jgi:outer membrane protein TolC
MVMYDVPRCLFSLIVLLTLARVSPARGGSELPPVPKLRSGEKLTLAEVVRQADERNRTLRATRVSIRSAEAKLKAARAPLFPNLYGNVTYQLRDYADTVQQNGRTLTTKPRHGLSAGLEAEVSLFDATRYKRIEVAREERDLATLTIEAVRQELLYTVAEAYYQAAALQRLIVVYENQSNALNLHLETAIARYRSGVGALVDVKRAKTDLLAIREEQVRAHFALEKARDALALLIDSEQPPLPVDDPKSLTAVQKTDTLSSAVLSRRWDLQIGRKTMSYNKKLLKLQKTQFVPSLSAFWQYDVAITTPEIPEDYDRTRWLLGAALKIPLFDYTFFPDLEIQRADLEQSRLNLETIEAEAREEITRSRWSLSQAGYLVATAEMKVALADETLELAQTNYVNGNGSALTVIDAQRSSQTAHVDLETRRFERELARLANLRARGEPIFDSLK